MAAQVQPCGTISNKDYPNCYLSITDDKKVTLSPSPPQVWCKVERCLGTVKAFAPVNLHTSLAMKPTGKDQPVLLVEVPVRPDGTINPDDLDQSLFWTKDTGNDGDNTPIKAFKNPDLVLYAEDVAAAPGAMNAAPGVMNNNISIMTGNWNGGNNQLWNYNA